jgi:fucose 4-O-acetylase-like acetyltransferase
VAAAVRDPWLDNAKMALVTLVVIGHGWTLLPLTALNSHVYDFLYVWHIPAFVFVTGYLSRSFSYTPRRLEQLVRTVVVPYLVFECAMALFRVYVGGERLEDLFADPHWPLWYLAALFFWRLLTPIFRPMRGGVVVALGCSLLAGLWFGDTLDLARVFGLLPFFVLGLKATPERLEPLRARGVKVAAVLVFVGIAVITRYTDRLAATEWLYYRSRYDEMVASDAEALLIRLVVLALGALGAFAFLALVPRRSGWFTRMGTYTLVVYLVHGFFVKGVSFTGFPGWAVDHPALSLVLVTTGGLLLALLLAWRTVATGLQDLVDPFGHAERHAKHAVAITAAAAREPEHHPPPAHHGKHSR